MVCQPLELPEKMRQVLHKSTIAMLPDSLPLERTSSLLQTDMLLCCKAQSSVTLSTMLAALSDTPTRW